MDNIEIYDSIRNDDGDLSRGRTKLFVTSTDDAGNIIECLYGATLVPEGSGTLYIVDDFIIDQINKIKVQDGQLVVKDGEIIDEPVKSELEIKEEELLKQLEELQKQKAADQ